MTRRVDYHPQFDCDVREAALWLDARTAGLGAELSLAVEEQIKRVVSNPAAYPELRPEFRRTVVMRFRYILVYRLRGRNIRFVGFVHGSRDLDAWLDRRLALVP